MPKSLFGVVRRLWLAGLLLPVGCYSFQGGSLPADLHSVAVPVVADRSGAGAGWLRPELMRGVLAKIESESGLRIADSMGRADAVLDMTLVHYSDAPSQLSAVTGRAGMNRVSVVVEASLLDQVHKRRIFSERFTGFADYPAGDFGARDVAAGFALRQIIDTIVDEVVSGWHGYKE